MAKPYQPSLLRLLHSPLALLTLASWTTGGLIYNQFDGRFGRLPLGSVSEELFELHGFLGWVTFLLLLPFALYALTLGWQRLRTLSNVLPLIALSLAVGSGLAMEEEWLEERQFAHLSYALHLSSWALLGLLALWHVVAILRRGGGALAVSMFRLDLHQGDLPGDWPKQIRRYLNRFRGQAPD